MMLAQVLSAEVIHEDLEVHLGFAAQLVDIGEKLPLVGANRLAQRFVVVEYSPEAEGQDGGVLKTVGDDPGMIHTGLVVQIFSRIVLGNNHGKVAGRIEEDLISTDAKDGF